MIRDKLVTGAVIGTAAFIIQNLYALGAKAFNIPTLTYVDYGRILLLSKVMKGTIAVIIGLIGHLIWEIILGVIFVYIILNTSRRYSFLKGIIFGASVWFFINLAATLFSIPVIAHVSPTTVTFFLIGSIIFGFTIAFTLNILHSYKIKI
ncbi:MAG: hypothetical protein ACOYI2_09115 [Bacillota bacterium]|jgi:hypothetical protein